MRVAFDEQIFLLQRTGGISRYFVELADFLSRTAGVEVIRPQGPIANELAATTWGLPRWRSRIGRRALVAGRRRKPPAPSPDADLIHHTFYDPAWLRRPLSIPRVVTVYDMIPEALPDQVPSGVHLAKREYVASADLILTISEFTRDELLRYLGTPDAPVVVTPLGVHRRFAAGAPRPSGFPRHYLLYVGQRAGYKDFTTLLCALAADPTLPDLMAIGGGPWTSAERQAMAVLAVSRRVHHRELGDPELVRAYTHAAAFVMTSRSEGFGLPLLEAMSAGTPAVAARAGALPEIGGTAISYFPPGDHEALAELLAQLLADPDRRDAMSRSGRLRARGYTWERTAAATAAAYHQLLAGTDRSG